MTSGSTDLSQAGFLVAATAVQLAIAVAAYLLGRAQSRAARPVRLRPRQSGAPVPAPADPLAARIKAAFRLAPDALLLCDPSASIIDVNDYAVDLIGYPRDELVGRSLIDLAVLSPEDQTKAATEFARLAGGQVSKMHPVEFAIRRGDAKSIPVEIRGDLIPWRGEGNSVLLSARDISEHKKAQARIREQQARLTLIFEQLPAHVWTTDTDLRILSAAGRGLHALGVTEAELVGRPLLEVMADSPILEQTRIVYGRALTGVTSPFATTLAGNEIEGVIGPLRDAAGKVEGVIGIGLNVTEESKARRRLLQSEALLEQAQRMAHMGSWEWEIASGCVRWSADLLHLLGIEADEGGYCDGPSDKMLEAYLSLVVEEDREAIRRGVDATMGEGVPYLIEHRLRRPDGTLRWLLTSGQVERDRSGKPLRFFGFIQDITTLKTAAEEVRHLNAELEQRVHDRTRQLEDAVEDLRSFSYAVSHDLRQPLRTISGFLTLLEEEAGGALGEGAHVHLDRVRAAAHRMDALIGDLLALSRVNDAPLVCTRLDLSAMAAEMVCEVEATDPARRAHWVIQSGLVVDADRGLMRLVLENLFGNAWKFTRGRDGARIEFGAEHAGASGGPGGLGDARHGEPVFFVRDNGAGFDSSQASRLFQPFQRLHDAREFEGTGVGLATVGRIIRRHGGQIRAEGRRGAGATFRFSLPAADPPAPA